ncbi:MAG: 2-oxoglutarate dehydrogenase E1 [Anaerolineae bacterium]|nr:2-oxoglutarate dehydrogenase E1 [Anaerolineae bacterium]
MKVITLTEPWATLVLLGAKKNETRSWQTNYRGQIGIQASKSFPNWAKDLCMVEPFASVLTAGGFFMRRTGWLYEHNFSLGCILGTCQLDGIERIHRGNIPPEPERTFGDFTPGRFAFHLSGPRRLPEPIPVRGALGVWEWTPPLEVAEFFAL